MPSANSRKKTSPLVVLDVDQGVALLCRCLKEWNQASYADLEAWFCEHHNSKIPKGLVKDSLKKAVEVGLVKKIKNQVKHGFPCYRLATAGETSSSPCKTSKSPRRHALSSSSSAKRGSQAAW